MNTVSIIVPVYNGESVIAKCLDSILNQTYSNIQVIVVNDGSQDKTKDIVMGFENRDSRVKVINKINEGVSVARNIGIKAAQGEFIQFVDCDDYIDKNMTENLVKNLNSNDAQLVICGVFLDTQRNGYTISNLQTFNYCIAKDNQIALEVLNRLNGTYINSPINKLYKRDIIVNNSIYMDKNIDLGEDLIFNLKYLFYCNKVVFLEDAFYHYILKQENSLTCKFRVNKIDLMYLIYEECNKYLRNKEVKYYEIRKLNSLFIKWMYSCFVDLNNKACKFSYIDKIKFVNTNKKKYINIINACDRSNMQINILRMLLNLPVVALFVSKVIYIIKNNYRDKLYGK